MVKDFKYIMRVYATPTSRPFHLAAHDEAELAAFVQDSAKNGDHKFYIVKYEKRDRQIEGALKRCSNGSAIEDGHLGLLFQLNDPEYNKLWQTGHRPAGDH